MSLAGHSRRAILRPRLPMSASLIGRLGSSTFRLSTCVTKNLIRIDLRMNRQEYPAATRQRVNAETFVSEHEIDWCQVG